MKPYKTKVGKLPSGRYVDLRSEALKLYSSIKRRTKRKPYIRSAYFKKQKVFLDFFWPHLFQKHPNERRKRLQYFPAALELIRYSHKEPKTKENPNNEHEVFHRFAGRTKEGDLFYVQVKENKRTGRKYFISCFPDKTYR